MGLLEQTEVQDDLVLASLKEENGFEGGFGISRIQRHFRIGYNRAAHMVERAIVAEGLVGVSDFFGNANMELEGI